MLALALLLSTATTPLPLPESFGSAPKAQTQPDAAWSDKARLFLVAWQEWSAQRRRSASSAAPPKRRP